jgi:hypothetical protein
MQVIGGQKSQQSAAAHDPVESRQLEDLFSEEWVRIQCAWFDPGSGGDRSGAQAFLTVALATLDMNYDRYAASWKELPERDRLDILAWRESALAKKERDSIEEAAKGAKAVVDPEAIAQRMASAIVELEAKWRALIESRKQ